LFAQTRKKVGMAEIGFAKEEINVYPDPTIKLSQTSRDEAGDAYLTNAKQTADISGDEVTSAIVPQ